MRYALLALIAGAVTLALGQVLVPSVRAEDERRQESPGFRVPYRPWRGGFEVDVFVGGRALPRETVGGEPRVEAVMGAEYELRLINPLPERVAVAVSVDGLNVVDARHTTAWDASKWVIHPHGTLTLSGWQVGPERARRFYFTTERDSYATRLGRPGDFGVISAVFYRERRPIREVIPRRGALHEPGESLGAAAAPATGALGRSASDGERGEARRNRFRSSWNYGDRAATGIGSSIPSDVREVSMELEQQPVAVVTLRYDFRPSPPRSSIVPGFAPEPPGERGWRPRLGESRFAPEP